MKILVYNIAASESGALSILDDFYNYIYNYSSDINWIFIVSTNHLSSKKNNIIIHSINKPNIFRRVIFEFIDIKILINNYKPDIIFSMQNLAILFTKIPQVIYLQQTISFAKDLSFSIIKKDERKYFFYKYIYKFLIKRSIITAQKVIVQTKWFKEAIISDFKFNSNKIYVIPPSVKIENRMRNIVSDKNILFYPTTPFKYKNVLLLVDAIKVLVNKGYNPVIFLTIEGNENDYARQVKKRIIGYEMNIRLIGRIPREEVYNYYNTSTLIFPSCLESFGLPLLEARLSGSFIIASDTPFSREILDGYDKAILFNHTSLSDLIKKIEYYLNNFSHLTLINTLNLSKNNFDRFSMGNTWSKIIEIIKNIY